MQLKVPGGKKPNLQMSLNDGTIFLGRDRKWPSDHVLCPSSLMHLIAVHGKYRRYSGI